VRARQHGFHFRLLGSGLLSLDPLEVHRHPSFDASQGVLERNLLGCGGTARRGQLRTTRHELPEVVVEPYQVGLVLAERLLVIDKHRMLAVHDRLRIGRPDKVCRRRRRHALRHTGTLGVRRERLGNERLLGRLERLTRAGQLLSGSAGADLQAGEGHGVLVGLLRQLGESGSLLCDLGAQSLGQRLVMAKGCARRWGGPFAEGGARWLLFAGSSLWRATSSRGRCAGYCWGSAQAQGQGAGQDRGPRQPQCRRHCTCKGRLMFAPGTGHRRARLSPGAGGRRFCKGW
jgi:hypothetical protein